MSSRGIAEEQYDAVDVGLAKIAELLKKRAAVNTAVDEDNLQQPKKKPRRSPKTRDTCSEYIQRLRLIVQTAGVSNAQLTTLVELLRVYQQSLSKLRDSSSLSLLFGKSMLCVWFVYSVDRRFFFDLRAQLVDFCIARLCTTTTVDTTSVFFKLCVLLIDFDLFAYCLPGIDGVLTAHTHAQKKIILRKCRVE
jgi:hypothetical protein